MVVEKERVRKRGQEGGRAREVDFRGVSEFLIGARKAGAPVTLGMPCLATFKDSVKGLSKETGRNESEE